LDCLVPYRQTQKSPKDARCRVWGVCFITAGPITKLFAWGEEDSGGHVPRETTRRGLCGGTRESSEEPGTLAQGAPVFPGSSRLGIEPKTTGWLVQDPTTRLGCRVWGCRVWGLGLKVAQRCKHLVYVSVVLFL